jgi:ligand-binding sensor domain-containing protein/signal transduction histidine kinase
MIDFSRKPCLEKVYLKKCRQKNSQVPFLRKIVFLVFFLSLFGQVVIAQTSALADYYLEHYTDENGLPQNSVKGIAKDKNGFIWLATEDGLVRFDGQKFHLFNKLDLSIGTNRIHGFAPSIKGYNIETKKFHCVTENNEFISINNDGSASVDKNYIQTTRYIAPYGKEYNGGMYIMNSLPSIYPFTLERKPYLVLGGNRNFYVWFARKIEYYKNGSLQYCRDLVHKDFFLLNTTPYVTLNSGDFARISANAETMKIRLMGDILQNPSHKNRLKDVKLFWDNISQRAFLYLNGDFYTLKESKDRSVLTTTLILSGFDFEDNKIAKAYYDEHNGNIYLGSLVNGLFVLKYKAFRALQMQEKTADNVYYSHIANSGNSFLTAQGYSYTRDRKSLWNKGTNVSSLMKNIGFKYFQATNTDGTFWMGIGSRLIKFDRTGKQILLRKTLNMAFKALYTDEQERLWIGADKNALFCLNTKDPRAEPQLVLRAAIGEISCIQQLGTDVLLLGTLNGLYRFHVKTSRLYRIKGLEHNYIRSIYNNANGSWITTYGDGFFLFKDNRVIQFPLDKDHFLATSHCMAEDTKGYFWITTNKGLFQVAQKDLLQFADGNQKQVFYLYYDKRHGFETNEFNGGCQPCAAILPDGHISFPSMNGLVLFLPDKLKAELPDKSIFISHIELDGNRIAGKDKIILPKDFKQLRLHLTTPYFANTKNIQLTYSLAIEGGKNYWVPVQDDFTIPITNISSGDYNLIIRKANGFGTNNFSYKKIVLYIPPAWYETWWFRILSIVFLLFLIFIIIKARTNYLIKKEREKNLYRHYRINNKLVAAINHDIQTPLHYINHSLEHLDTFLNQQHQTNQGIIKISRETLDTSIRLSTLTSTWLDYIKVQSENQIVASQLLRVDVYQLVGQLCQLFFGVANFRKIQVNNQISKNLHVYSDQKLLSIIIHNLLDNAVKVSTATVSIFEVVEYGENQIVIEDSGNGMPAELIYWLNKQYNSYEEWTHAPDYLMSLEQKGIGLLIVKDLSVFLSIRLTVTSLLGKGTTIKLIFEDFPKHRSID